MLIADQVFIVNLHHDGIFIPSTLRYLQGDLKQITDIDFEGMSFDVFRDIIKPLVHGIVYSDEIKEFDDVDFYTEGEENIVIKNLTTHDPFLNKLCGNNGMFRDYLDESVPQTKGKALDGPDDAHIDLILKAQKGVLKAVDVLVSIVIKRKKIKKSLFHDEDTESSKSAKSAPKSSKKGAKSTKSVGKPAKSAGKSAKKKVSFS
uniref:Splicing factor n=1 Tax=Tanacetum cinerariifolium TaxID=118510 RepID=A0A699IJX5_TANCI|nr:splicing factor [Tanacetum cinerariifolium]